MELDDKGGETTDYYSLDEIKQILKEQKEERRKEYAKKASGEKML